MLKLSIITVNLNNREGLRKTAESVVSQTYKDYEWIVIDGGSTDGSVEIIKDYVNKAESKDIHCYWVSESDKGIYNAMNKGIKVAKGEYCLFLNSGDIFVNNIILIDFLKNDFSEDVVYGDYLADYGTYQTVCQSPHYVTLKTFIEGTIHHTGNSFIHRDAFEKWGYYDESFRIVSDWKWFLETIGFGTASTRYIDMVISVFDCYSEKSYVNIGGEERERILRSLIPPRVLQDYKNYSQLEIEKYQQELKIRSSKAYKLGNMLLSPIKRIKKVFENIF